MTVLLVTYDLKKPGQDYAKFHETLKQFTWARLSESSYAIQTSNSLLEIYNLLKNHIDVNDQLYVIPLGKPYYGYGPKDVNEWLTSHL